MSLSVPSSGSVGAHNSNWSSSGTSMTSNARNDFIPPMKQNPVRISCRTTEFVKGIEKKVFDRTATTSIKALKEVIQLVSKNGVTPIQDALLKRSSYFTRWFSDETWEDWTQYRTPLGRVVSMYCDYITSSTRLAPCISRLDKKLLEVANREAAEILKSLHAEKDSSKPEEISAPSSWSSFFSLPMAEAASLGKARFPANFDLSSLDGENGFALNGENAGDQSGGCVRGAGDINGDGIADFVVGAEMASSNGIDQTGRSYVVFGSNMGWGTPLELSALVGVNGFIIYGEAQGDSSGISVNGAGDINGDGIDDLIVGAFAASPNGKLYAGKSYVVFGSKNPWISPFQLSSLNGINGFIMNGENPKDESGFAVSGAGDFNGDGITDVIIGTAINARVSPDRGSGRGYVVFGSKNPWETPLELSQLNGVNGFVIIGENLGDVCGYTVSRAGDINGDGIADLAVGAFGAAPGNKTGAGRTYVIFGSHRGWWTNPFYVSSLNGKNGFMLDGEAANDYSSTSLGSAGDVNNDGIGDLIIGAQNANRAYLIYGHKGVWTSPIKLSSLNGANGFIINGEAAARGINAVGGAGDVNGDAIDDIIIGSTGAFLPNGGGYVIYGSNNSQKSPFELSSLNGINGFMIKGVAASDGTGNSVSGAGDINGDGIHDMAIGAAGASPNNKTFAGRSYLVFGEKTI